MLKLRQGLIYEPLERATKYVHNIHYRECAIPENARDAIMQTVRNSIDMGVSQLKTHVSSPS
jgi:hypothetical protein